MKTEQLFDSFWGEEGWTFGKSADTDWVYKFGGEKQRKFLSNFLFSWQNMIKRLKMRGVGKLGRKAYKSFKFVEASYYNKIALKMPVLASLRL